MSNEEKTEQGSAFESELTCEGVEANDLSLTPEQEAEYAAREEEDRKRKETYQRLRAELLQAAEGSAFLTHCRRELKDWFNEEDGPDRWIAERTEELLALLSLQGHSGGSIGFALEVFRAMASFEPWGPLTGEDDEWQEVGDGLLQNIRCSHVFKENGVAYDIEGKIFREPNGCCFTNRDSFVEITFPYNPTSEYVDVPEMEEEPFIEIEDVGDAEDADSRHLITNIVGRCVEKMEKEIQEEIDRLEGEETNPV